MNRSSPRFTSFEFNLSVFSIKVGGFVRGLTFVGFPEEGQRVKEATTTCGCTTNLSLHSISRANQMQPIASASGELSCHRECSVLSYPSVFELIAGLWREYRRIWWLYSLHHTPVPSFPVESRQRSDDSFVSAIFLILWGLGRASHDPGSE